MTAVRIPARVHRLTATLANQIAAGEVVERPASVVKELLENSLDAGAREVCIDVERGGTRLIRLRDDGEGIHPDDLVLALDRHATSKIVTLDDLTHIASLGFRGEALPSIASVSRLSITSRCQGSDTGWRMTAEGKPPEAALEPVPHPVGTTVEVRDLFFNTPARRKFLRSDRTEFGHLQEVVRRIGLSRLDLAVRLNHERREVIRLRAGLDGPERSRRVAAVCGAAFLQQAVPVEFEAVGLRLWGWIGGPEHSRSAADGQFFFLNGRTIRDKLVSHAVRQAYADVLPPGRQPAYVLYLEMEPTQADVNVHPTKHEVRFRDGRLVHDFVARHLAHALGSTSMLVPSADAPAYTPRVAGRTRGAVRFGGERIRESVGDYAALMGGGGNAASPLGYSLGQVHGRFLLARNELGLVLVDMPAAWRRVTESRLRLALEQGQLKSQPLLVPVSVELPPGLAGMAEEKPEPLRRLGFDVVRNGPASVAVHRVPALLKEAEPQALVKSALAALAKHDPDGATGSDLVALIPALTADATPTFDGQSREDLDRLLQQVDRESALNPGSPLWVQPSESDLEGLFKRCSSSPGIPSQRAKSL
ncbi:MAG: DNA mismatch repair endonuclease MutL [Gammaproteobacteria bacterium]|nr:DNA mismatch repair endonuclease MutL [Gammaproteobacteria bacterium]